MVDAGFVPLDVVLRNHEPSRQQLATKLLFLASQQLSAMHSAGKVHGDLRCEHILVAPDLQTVTLGGLVHSFDWNELRFRVRSSDTTASELGISVSSAVRWLAPECVGGAVPSPASDMYAFGMTVYEALTGTVPFEDHDEISVVDLKKRKQTVLPDRHLAKLDREAWSLVQDACHHNPIFRPSVQIAMMTLRNLQSKAPTPVSVVDTTSTTLEAMPPGVTATCVPVGGHGTVPTYHYPMAVSTYQYIPSAVPITTATTTTVRQPYENKVLPAGVSTLLEAPASAVAPTPMWKKVARVVVLAAIIAGIAVPVSVLTASSTSASSVDDSAPTLTPTNSPPSPSPTPTQQWTPSPSPTVKQPGTLPTRLPSSGSLVATLIEAKEDYYGSITALAVASDGTVYASDGFLIYSFREDSTAPPTLIAGSTTGYANGQAKDAHFGHINGLAFDAQGNLLVADGWNWRLRRVRFDTNPYIVENVAGNGERNTYGGALLKSAFMSLTDIAVSPSTGIIYVTSNYEGAVRTVDLSQGQVSEWRTYMESVVAVAVSPQTGEVYVSSGSSVRWLSPSGLDFYTAAGNANQGYSDANGGNARFSNIGGLAFSPTGNMLYIADSGNNCIRKLDVATLDVTTLAGLCDMSVSSNSVDGDFLTARFVGPKALAMGPDGTLYVADNGGMKPHVRRIKLTP